MSSGLLTGLSVGVGMGWVGDGRDDGGGLAGRSRVDRTRGVEVGVGIGVGDAIVVAPGVRAAS
jgi:hypothetical protein